MNKKNESKLDMTQISLILKRKFNDLRRIHILVLKELNFSKRKIDSLLPEVDTETKKKLYSPHESIRLIQDKNQWFYDKKRE